MKKCLVLAALVAALSASRFAAADDSGKTKAEKKAAPEVKAELGGMPIRIGPDGKLEVKSLGDTIPKEMLDKLPEGIREKLSKGGGPFGGGRGRDRDRPLSADEISQRVAGAEQFLKRLDVNGNGQLDADEVPEGHGRVMLERMLGRVGIEPKYPLLISDITQAMEKLLKSQNAGASSSKAPPKSSAGDAPQPPSAPASGDSAATRPDAGKSAAPASDAAKPGAEAAKPAPRKSGRFLTARERLPKGLPDWFLEHVNDDGQVTMAEFVKDGSPDAAATFAEFDLNHDGIITPAECLKALKHKPGS